MGTLRTVVSLAVSAVVVISAVMFASANSTTLDVDYLVGEVSDVAVWKALAVSAGMGATVVGGLLGVAWLRARLETRRYRKAVVALEAEVRKLREGGGDPAFQAPGDETSLRASGRAERGR